MSSISSLLLRFSGAALSTPIAVPRVRPSLPVFVRAAFSSSRAHFSTSPPILSPRYQPDACLAEDDLHPQQHQVVDRSLIAPWFHELDDMPEERLCLIATPCSSPPSFPPMPVSHDDSTPSSVKPRQPRRQLHTLSALAKTRSIHTSPSLSHAATDQPPDSPSTPYASDAPTQLDRNKQVRDQAQWQETQQAGTACPTSPPSTAAGAPAADASNPTNAYGKLHPADTGGRGHMGLGEHEQSGPPTAWDTDAQQQRQDTKTEAARIEQRTDTSQADDDADIPKPEDFVGACAIWPPLASLLIGHRHGSGAASARYHRVSHAFVWREYATKTTPKVAEIVNPAGTGGSKPRVRQSMQETVHVKAPIKKSEKAGKAFTTVEGGQEQQEAGDEFQDGAVRNPHRELMGSN